MFHASSMMSWTLYLTLYYTLYCTLKYTLHSTLYLKPHVVYTPYILHSTLHSTLYPTLHVVYKLYINWKVADWAMNNIFLPNYSILLPKTLLYNVLSILYSNVLGKDILELERKMYCELYWRLYCATNIPLYCILYCTLYCKSYCTRTSKWLDYSFWNNTLPASSMMNCTQYCTLYYTYCNLHYIVHCT